jgi:hypothetical protein
MYRSGVRKGGAVGGDAGRPSSDLERAGRTGGGGNEKEGVGVTASEKNV